MGHDNTIIGLGITILGALVVTTWRFSAMVAKLQAVVRYLKRKEREQDRQYDHHEVRITRLENRTGLQRLPSRPDAHEEDDDEEDSDH